MPMAARTAALSVGDGYVTIASIFEGAVCTPSLLTTCPSGSIDGAVIVHFLAFRNNPLVLSHWSTSCSTAICSLKVRV